jgi:hypothetical protein
MIEGESGMQKDPQTTEEWTIHALNIHGAIFERWCQEKLSDARGWQVVSSNYPVEFPPQSDSSGRTASSTLDILARSTDMPGSRIRTLLVECEKNNPNFIDWIFFRKGSNSEKNQYRYSQIRNQKIENYFTGWETRASIDLTVAEMPLADEAREVKGVYSKQRTGDNTKTANNAIWDAASQIALATQAIIAEEMQRSVKQASAGERREQLARLPEYGLQVFIPMIVTTAKLFLCEFDPRDANPATGTIDFANAKLTPHPYIIYEFPLLPALQSDRGANFATLTRKQLEKYVRMDIVVVNSEHFADLLQGGLMPLSLPD